MYKRDLVTAEIENLTKILARIMDLKLEGDLSEAEKIFDEALITNFKLNPTLISDKDSTEFKNWLMECNLGPEKLDSLSEFLYYELGSTPERNQLIAPKLNLIYQTLANKHKIIHLTNLHRQQTLQQYL